MHWVTLLNLWSLFLMSELTEVMRQRGNQTFIYILNKIRVDQHLNDIRNSLQQKNINLKNSLPDAINICQK